ncbi:MAG: YDG domain-containing protein, partial [Clostridiales bacterium]|nr:YDG domain-containing protein [Clostridiales bacterium]
MNSASGNSSNGGGVYVYYGGSFEMSGGTISSNTASSNGGGVYVYNSGKFTVSGTPVVSGNTLKAGTKNNVYLPSGKYITLAGALTSGASVGVTTQTAPTESTAVEITTAEDGTDYYSDSLSHFSSDNTDYYVRTNSTGNYLELGLCTKLTASDFTVNTEDETYTGSAITKTITSPTDLVKDTDYTVSYSNNTDAGTATITITGSGAYSGTLTYNFTINKKTVIPSISGSTSKTYDGGITSTGSGLTIELDGFVDDDEVTISATYTYDDKNVGTGKTITASGISLSGEDAGNYTLSATTAEAAVGTITAKEIAITDFNLNLNDETYTGSAITKTITSDLTEDTDYTVTYDNNINAGTATIIFTGKGNCTGTFGVDFTIKPATLTATISGETTKTYDGTEDVTDEQGLTITLDGVVASDAGKVSATASFAYDSADVADATTITASGISLSGDAADNYTVADSVTTTGSITAKTVTPSITGTASKTYDGDNTAQGLSIELTGVVGSDNVTASATSYTYDSADIGTDKTITASGITLSGTAAGNYALSSDTATTNGTITTKEISTSDFTVDTTDETYTGSAIEKTITSSLTKGTDYTVTYDGNTNAGTATITITGTGNYSGTLTYNFTIDPITLTPSINGTTTKTYDATTDVTDAQGLSITLADVVDGDTVTASATYAYNDKNVGTDKTITASGITLSGADKDNYTLSSDSATITGSITAKALSESDFTVDTDSVTYTGSAITKNITSNLVECTDYIVDYNKNKNAGTATISIMGRGNYTGEVTYTFTIAPKTLTPSISGTTTKTYDGDTAVTDGNLSIALSGIVTGDTVTASASYAYGSKNVGEGKTITASNITLGGTSASNYTLSTTTVTANVGTISAKTLTASINGNTTKTYDATTDVTDAQGLSITLADVVDGDTVTASATYAYNDKNVGTDKTITASGITLSGADKDNYTLSSDSATITGSITAKALSESDFTVDTDEVTYTGSAITNKTITTTLSADDFTYSFSNNTNAGTATITITGTGNCTGSVSYDFIIRKATPTVSLTGVESKTYDGTAVSEPTVNVTLVDNAMYTQKITYFSVADDGTETELTDAPSAAGNYKVVVTVDAGSNYNTTSVEASFEIFKAEQEVKIEGFADVPYDGQAHEVTVTADDNATVTVTYMDADGNTVEAPVNAGTYTAHVTVTRDNYVTVEHDVGVSIALATQDVTVEGFSVTYDGQAHEVTVTADDDATVTVTYTDADGNAVASPVNAGTYTAHVTVTRDNYVTVEQDVEVSIALATQSVTIDSIASVVYDGKTFQMMVTAASDATVTVTYTDADGNVVES